MPINKETKTTQSDYFDWLADLFNYHVRMNAFYERISSPSPTIE